jgi:hypothetical protein
VRDTYGREYFYRPYEAMKNAGTAGTSLTPDPVLNAIEDALLTTQTKARYLIDSATGIIDRSAVSIIILLIQNLIAFIPYGTRNLSVQSFCLQIVKRCCVIRYRDFHRNV